MLRRQRGAVHLVREDGAALECLVHRQAALVALLDVALDPAVEASEDDVDCIAREPRLLEQGRERHASPPGGPDRLHQPRLADRPRLEQRAAVAGALHRRGQIDPWAHAELVEAERQRTLDGAPDLEPPRFRLDERDVVVDQQVVQPDGRDRPAERLERHRVVARGEAQLVERDPWIARECHAPTLQPRSGPVHLRRTASCARAR